MDRETMPSITDWSLWASVHHEPVPSQVTAAGSCAQVTRPGTTPRGTPNGESGSNKEGRRYVEAARARANCRRVMSILTCSSRTKSYGCADHLPESAETAAAPSQTARSCVADRQLQHPVNRTRRK